MIDTTLCDGHEIVTLKNDQLSLSLNLTRGNIISSLVVDGEELIFLREPNYHSTDRPTCGAPILFPYSGNNANDELLIHGKSYATGIHGIVHTNTWTLESQDEEACKVRMKTTSNESTKEAFPFDFELIAELSIVDTTIRYDLYAKNLSDNQMPCDFGLHPFFKISGLDECAFSVNGKSEKLDATSITTTGKMLNDISQLCVVDNGRKVEYTFSNIECFKNILVWSGDPEQFLVIEPLTAQPNAINEGKNYFNLKSQDIAHVCFEMKVNRI